jgi:methyl-accepting chemotaxis protein
MVNEQDFIELNNNYDTSGKCGARIFNLFSIPTLLYTIIILGYIEIINFNVQIHSVILIGLIFLIYINFIRHNAYFSSCKFRKQYIELKDGLKKYINKNKLEIDNITKANASIDDFLHEFTITLRNTNFSSVASGIFPTLGILGTFISIAVSMPDFSSGSSDMLEKEISLLLGGVGTAFYVSIYGIFLSIWWIFFEKLGMSRFQRDIIIIKENTKSFFWNKMDVEKMQFQKSIANYEKMSSVFENLDSNTFLNNINNVLHTKVKLFEDMFELEKASLEKSTQHIKQREEQLDKFVESYGKISQNMESLSTYIHTSTQSLENINTNIKINENSMDYISSKLNINIEILNKSLEHISGDNIKVIYDTIATSMKHLQNETSHISNTLTKDIDDFDNNITKKLSNSLELIDEETTKVVSKIAKLKL